MRETIPQKKLDFWIAHNYNILLEGKHGVGKTSAIFQALTRHNLNYQYFSCSTLDPWVDFVGIPKEKYDEEHKTFYLDLVRPKFFAFDQVEVIVLDEMNRAPPKVMNALMELIQFKSINGKKLNNLKLIIAAINPPAVDDKDPQYHVQELDPAVRSRFHVKYEVPFKIAEEYFESKYGKETTKRLVNWWDAQPINIRNEFPPREIEHALMMLHDGGDINDTLPSCIKKSTFIKAISEDGALIIKTAPTNSGVTQNVNFINASASDLKLQARDKTLFTKHLKALSHEEFIQLFKRIGPTNSKNNPTLSVLGSRLLDMCTKEQLESIMELDFSSMPKTFENNINNTLNRVCKQRKITRKYSGGVTNLPEFDVESDDDLANLLDDE